jgi:hypothetical protein
LFVWAGFVSGGAVLMKGFVLRGKGLCSVAHTMSVVAMAIVGFDVDALLKQNDADAVEQD